RGGVGTLTIELAGDLARTESGPVTAAALRGLLETTTTERVNLVNAAILAKARGINVVERKTADAGGFSAAVTLRASPSGSGRAGEVAVGGTLAGGEMRIVRLNAYRLDMAAEDRMLITRPQDRPGTIGPLRPAAGPGAPASHGPARPAAGPRGREHQLDARGQDRTAPRCADGRLGRRGRQPRAR